MKTIYNKDHFAKLKSLNERISKNAEIGGAYFGYLMLYKLGTCKYIDICTSKVFKEMFVWSQDLNNHLKVNMVRNIIH